MAVYNNLQILPAKVEKLKAKIKDSKKATKSEKATDKLIIMLNDKDYLIRRGAIETIGILEVKKAIPNLITCLGDIDDRVRSAACVILGQFKAKEAVNSLILKLAEYDTGEVWPGGGTPLEFEERKWNKILNSGVALYAADALKDLGEKKWAEFFKGTSTSQEYINNLALSKDPRIIQVLINNYNSIYTANYERLIIHLALKNAGLPDKVLSEMKFRSNNE